MTAPTIDNVETAADAGTLTPTTAVSVGDVLIIVDYFGNIGLTPAQPTGGANGTWTKIVEDEIDATRDHSCVVWAKLAEADDVGATFTPDAQGGILDSHLLLTLSGNDTASIAASMPDTPTSLPVADAEQSNPISFTAITTSVDDSLVIGIVSGNRTAGGGSTDIVSSWGTLAAIIGSFISSGGTGGRGGVSAGSVVKATAGSQGGAATVDLQSDTGDNAILVLIAVAPPAPPASGGGVLSGPGLAALIERQARSRLTASSRPREIRKHTAPTIPTHIGPMLIARRAERSRGPRLPFMLRPGARLARPSGKRPVDIWPGPAGLVRPPLAPAPSPRPAGVLSVQAVAAASSALIAVRPQPIRLPAPFIVRALRLLRPLAPPTFDVLFEDSLIIGPPDLALHDRTPDTTTTLGRWRERFNNTGSAVAIVDEDLDLIRPAPTVNNTRLEVDAGVRRVRSKGFRVRAAVANAELQGSNDATGFYARSGNFNNGYYALRLGNAASPNTIIGKLIDGAWSDIATTDVTWVNGEEFVFEGVQGSSNALRIYQDAAVVLATTDSDFVGGGYCGVVWGDVRGAADDVNTGARWAGPFIVEGIQALSFVQLFNPVARIAGLLAR